MWSGGGGGVKGRVERSLQRAAGNPPVSSPQTEHKIPNEATKPVRALTWCTLPTVRVCVCLPLCVCGVYTFFLCLCVVVYVCVPYVIKGSKQWRAGGRQVMQSTEVRERTRGRQEGREGGREEELLLLGIRLSRNVLMALS